MGLAQHSVSYLDLKADITRIFTLNNDIGGTKFNNVAIIYVYKNQGILFKK